MVNPVMEPAGPIFTPVFLAASMMVAAAPDVPTRSMSFCLKSRFPDRCRDWL
jgi:hypothetical protein